MDFKHIYTYLKFHLLVPACLLNLVFSTPVNAISDKQLSQLEQDFQRVSSKIYTSLAKNVRECQARSYTMQQLNTKLNNLAQQGKQVIGLCVINNHLELISKHIDSKEIFPVFQFLLDNNHVSIANKLYRQAKDEGDQSLVSNISFIYARYFLKRKNWQQVLKYTKGIYSDLTVDDANLGRLYTGISLQHLKKHRTAVKVYSKIPPESRYYPAARLNIATAYIRQDWWTDAHNNINEILNSKKIKANREMINRLYLVLGYSLLRKEFYRDSREAFRNIEIDSVYFNKALLGIALTATNQEDYVSALNAINILKSSNYYDLAVDESHLLLPYTYEKLSQNMTASASYTDAKKYYETRIKDLNELISKKQYTVNAENILKNNNKIIIDKNTIYFTDYYPISFLENHAQINQIYRYSSDINNKKLKNSLSKIKTEYDTALSNMISDSLNIRKKYLNSYMNQSRYGLARLFDNSNFK